MSKKLIHKIWEDGSETWHLNGFLHREVGPAVIYLNGRKEWWINGKRHRKNGPALVLPDRIFVWYLHNREYSLDMWCNILNLPYERRIELKLLYG